MVRGGESSRPTKRWATHTTSAKGGQTPACGPPPPPPPPPPPETADCQRTQEFTTVEAQISPLFDDGDDAGAESGTAFLRRKWLETCAGWEAIQRDAEMLNDELKEDKWLTVFRVRARFPSCSPWAQD